MQLITQFGMLQNIKNVRRRAHLKNPLQTKPKHPSSQQFSLVVKKNIIKVVPVSSDDDSEEEPLQVRKNQSNNSRFKDMEVDSQYVPPRRQQNSSPEQDMDHVPGRLRNSSPKTQSLPPGTDIDDASSLFNDNLTDEEDEEDLLRNMIKEPKKFAKEPVATAPCVWSPETEYEPPSSSAMQEVLGKAVTTSIGLFLIQDVYPDVAVQESMLQNALVSVATEVGLDEMAEQLCAPDERKWRKPLADYVFNRVVHVHLDVKKHVESIILDTRPPPEFDEMVVPATDVPATEAAEVAEKPLIITKLVKIHHWSCGVGCTSTLHSMFTGPTSPGQTFLSAFSSLLDEEKYPDLEPEVPMSMLAFAATAVHFCLSKWATGSLHPGEFKGSKARSEYYKNMELLQRMQKDDMLQYHDLMSNMLTQAI
ncbi:hypothetical protein BT96DRAFT_948373 [Gymnopus androsaceus JB14]|uniref:DUF6532 domain-containing protein n=1 Tax=Gymnopus androsaceus JB14 TaxID=1447944 RepID=A0A6A4GNR7_9AGAR|nr:hypothetical protein BT96DRAFT_948373 [Gymnopus androsaceus JB14]